MEQEKKKKVGAQCLIDDVERTMCRTSKKNQPPFSGSSEQLPQTMTLSSRGGGGSALLSPLHPRGLHKASALMYNISQPRSTINLRHRTRTKYEEDGEGRQQQIAVPLTKHYSAQAHGRVAPLQNAGSPSAPRSAECQNSHLLCVTQKLNIFIS